jgi:hypothetical protein
VEPAAEQQIEIADEWWQVNRTAVPMAIREDFQSMAAKLALSPEIGRRATNTKARNVRQVSLKRVGYFIYYRIAGQPARLEILALWHSSRGKGPQI